MLTAFASPIWWRPSVVVRTPAALRLRMPLLHPVLEGAISRDPFSEQSVSFSQRMTGIGVEFAGECLGLDTRDLILGQPLLDSITDTVERGTILLRHDVFIKGAEDHQHVIAVGL